MYDVVIVGSGISGIQHESPKHHAQTKNILCMSWCRFVCCASAEEAGIECASGRGCQLHWGTLEAGMSTVDAAKENSALSYPLHEIIYN